MFHAFVWFVCDVLRDVVWIDCFFAACVYVCWFAISVFVCLVCDVLCDVRWFACFLYWLCSCVCYVLCLFVFDIDLFVWCCMVCCVCVLCWCVGSCVCALFVNSCVM